MTALLSSVSQTINQSVNKPSNQSIDHLVYQPASHLNQSAMQPDIQSVSQKLELFSHGHAYGQQTTTIQILAFLVFLRER